jgi:hypothetical protein
MISLETERQIRREWALRAERMQPAASPFHPDYGLPQPHRLKVLHLADQTNPATAAETYNVGLSTIYNWRRIMRGA